MFKKSQKIFNKEGNLTYKVSRFCKTCGQFADISFKNMVLIPQLQTGTKCHYIGMKVLRRRFS